MPQSFASKPPSIATAALSQSFSRATPAPGLAMFSPAIPCAFPQDTLASATEAARTLRTSITSSNRKTRKSKASTVLLALTWNSCSNWRKRAKREPRFLPHRGRCSDPPRRLERHGSKAGESSAIEAIVKREQAIAVVHGVRPDQKIGEDTAWAGINLLAPPRSVGLKGAPGDPPSFFGGIPVEGSIRSSVGRP